MRRPRPVLSAFIVLFQLGGMFMLPWIVGLIAALFFEVSQVAETAPALFLISVVYIFPVFVLQLVGVFIKTSRELRDLRKRGERTSKWFLEVLARHVSIITPRGWAVMWTGVAFLVLALSVKWASLGTLSVLAFLLFYGVVGVSSLLSAFFARSFEMSLGRRGGEISRMMSPALVRAGEAAEERFTLARVPVPIGYCLLIDDDLHPKLSTKSRHVLGAGVKHTQITVSGKLRRTPRGLYRVGPAKIWYQDLLGLTKISVASVAMAELKVVPRFCELLVVSPPRSTQKSPDIVTRPHRFPTDDYFRFKEYTPGDDTRRINWKLSVRTGRLQIRIPETREVSVDTVILALDTFMDASRLPDAVGVEEVLDRLVETWISLAAELKADGEKVTLVAVADDGRGGLQIEQMDANRTPTPKWQDLGARVRWQSQIDLPDLLEDVGPDVHGVAMSARFQAPPPEPFPGQRLSWIYYPPDEALGPNEPPLWQHLVGPGPGAGKRLAAAFFKLPYPAGSDENAFFAQIRGVFRERKLYSARQRLRALARGRGRSILSNLVARGDVVYRLEPGPHRHRIIGMSAGGGGAS